MLKGYVSKDSEGMEADADFTAVSIPLKILLVEDGDHDRIAISHALRDGVFRPCEVVSFSRGKDALRAFCDSPGFDLAIVDYKIPDFDGLKLVSELKRVRHSIVAILVTGYDHELLSEKARQHGCDYFLSKSIKGNYLDELKNKIEESFKQLAEHQSYFNKPEKANSPSDGLADSVLELSGLATWDFRRATGGLRLGSLWRRILGYQLAEISSLSKLIALVHPDDRKILRKAWLGSRKGLSISFSAEFRMLTVTGAWLWVSSDGRIAEADGRGRPLRAFGAIKDIDERKRSEDSLRLEKARYESMLNSIEGVVWAADLETMRFTFVSRGVKEMLGFPPEKWLSEPYFWLERVHPDDRDKVIRKAIPDIKAGRVRKLEYRLIAADGRIVWVSSSKTNLFSEDGRMSRRCGLLIDISSRISFEKELKNHSEQVATVNSELLEYASEVSHDLKSPLRAIHSYASFLYEDLAPILTKEQDEYFRSLWTAAAEADSMVDGLLRVSRISSHKLDWQCVDLTDLFTETLSGMQIPKNTSVNICRDLPKIDSEPLLLRQIFQNLIDNAIKFNNSTEKQVWLQFSESPTHWLISVADNGIGIDQSCRDRIFSAFERLRPGVFEGNGIGLSIVKRALQRLSGSVKVCERPGGGSIFEISLPKKIPDQAGGCFET